jgi:hypothetical protein
MHALTALLAQAASGPIQEPISNSFLSLESDERFAALAIVVGCATGIIISLGAFVAGAIDKVHRRRVESDLKRDMLDRGMSADEVVKVIEAAAPPDDATQRWIASWCRKKK